MLKNITILGSTGTIGRQALDVCRRLNLRPLYLTGHENVELMAAQIKEFKPAAAVLASAAAIEELKHMLTPQELDDCDLLYGPQALKQVAAQQVDRVLVAISGFAALEPVDAALEAGNDLALANKEALVVAGDYLLAKARAKNLKVYPVDSEHSAIWQCLAAAPPGSCSKLYLTASGGPFFGWNREELCKVTPAMALQHPVWSMGHKITIDSASLMNKGLELIEAMRLFDLPEEQIEVLIHPEGIIHSMVELKDGSILAQAACPDMRLPIQLALSWPERYDSGLPKFDFFAEGKSRQLNFYPPDHTAFPALKLARQVANLGGLMPLVYNSANEYAVSAFCTGKLSFTGISQLVEAAVVYFSSNLNLTDVSLNVMMESDKLIKDWCRDYLADHNL